MNAFALCRRKLEERLAQFGVERPEARQEALLILEHVTGLPQTEQIVSNWSELEPAWLEEIESIMQDRRRRVPIQYILGKAPFMGLELKVQAGVLIPRPDTETLVQTVFDLSKARGSPGKIGEIGVGAGPIAISLLRKFERAKLCACDISPLALAIAADNARLYGVSERLDLIEGDWRTSMPGDFDLIVSNPPYVSLKQKVLLSREVADYEPEKALFNKDEDGLSFFRAFAEALPGRLKAATGWLALEFGDKQWESVAAIFERSGWREVTIHHDVHGLPRVITAVVPEGGSC